MSKSTSNENSVICGWTGGYPRWTGASPRWSGGSPLICKYFLNTLKSILLYYRYLYLPPIWADPDKEEMNPMLTNHVNESESTTTPTIISHIIEMPQATKKQYFLVWASILLF